MEVRFENRYTRTPEVFRGILHYTYFMNPLAISPNSFYLLAFLYTLATVFGYLESGNVMFILSPFFAYLIIRRILRYKIQLKKHIESDKEVTGDELREIHTQISNTVMIQITQIG